jgi:hypothetical protein
MEAPDDQFQRRLIIGDRHFILADPKHPDCWALAGPVISAEDEQGNRTYTAARTLSTAQLRAWAFSQQRSFSLIEKYPVVRRGISEAIAA